MSEPLYDEEMLRKVALLAARLQLEQEKQLLKPGQRLTAAEMDAIGEDMGLDPALMRQALGYLQARQESEARARQQRRRQWILGGVALCLFLTAGGILAYKYFLSGAWRMPGGLPGNPFASMPQIKVTLKRPGEPTLDEVMEVGAGTNEPADSPNGPVVPNPSQGTVSANSGAEAMDAAGVERYLAWVKRAEAERAKLALRLVKYGQQMRSGYGGNTEQTRQLTDAPVRELQEFRTAVESVHPEVPDPCRSVYYSYRSAVQKDTREAEGLATAFFHWKSSDSSRYGYASTREVLQRYERPASELESFLKSRNHALDTQIAMTEDTCLLRSLNFGMGNF